MRFKIQFLVAALAGALHAQGQGSFQNLDFESASVPVISSDQSGGFVPISNGLPGWSGYLGTNQQSQVLHNDLFVGTANISILGPDFDTNSIIEGNFSVMLQAGENISGTATLPASIAQTSLVPVNAQSLLFKAGLGTRDFMVTINGQPIPILELSTGSNYKLFGGDISSFADTIGELRITALSVIPRPLNNLLLDSIKFSSTAIPEPNMFSLLAIGALLLGWRFFPKRR